MSWSDKPVKVLTEKAENIGVSYDVIRKVKDELNIKSERQNSIWLWKCEK